MKPNNKLKYDIQYNKFKKSSALNDGNIPPFDELVKAQKIWLKKTQLQMVIRYSLSCIAIIAVAFLGFFFLRNKPQQNLVSKNETSLIVKDTSVIKAPVKEWDIAYQKFKINADSLTVIKMPSGTSITITPNSIADSSGKIVKGEVEIECREFFDPIDIMVAGIPMQYDSAGSNYTLETAGMIEINGSQNNHKLKIAEGKSIVIAQMSFGDNDFNTYSLDTKSGKWTYKGRPQNKPIESAAPIVSKDIEINAGLDPVPIHPSSIQEDNKPLKLSPAPKLQDESNPCFRLEVDKNTFPELAVYNNVLFEVKPGQGFNSTNEEWDWIDLKQGNRPNEYKVFLHDRGKTITAIVSPVFKEGDDYKEALRTFKKYEKEALGKIEETKKIWEENRRKLERDAQIAALIEIEKRKKYIDENAVIREFYVTNFGYWNSDRPCKRASPRSMKMKVELNEKDINLFNLFQIEKGINTLWVDYRIEPNTFYIQYDASKENIWFVIIPNSKKIAVVFPADFSRQISNNIGVLKMEVSEMEFKNPRELKNYLLSNKQ